MDKIQLKILGISAGNVASSYTLILEEVVGERKLPIVIGVLEAQAIAIQLEKIEPIRPMTHDLFLSFAKSFNLKLKEIIIQKLHEGIFYSYLVATNGKETKFIDSRTSDAIALALRFNCPIYTYESIMKDAGIAMKSEQFKEADSEEDLEDLDIEKELMEDDNISPTKEDDLSSLQVRELKLMLEKAIAEEDYILAAKCRDAIKKKEEGK